jgi:hypothetical protein
MKNTLSKSEIKLENLKMWLTEQIERYMVLVARNRGKSGEMVFTAAAAAYKSTLARLTEDEK